MNVKICNLPENDDPDSFVTNKKLKEVESYFEENSKDFIEQLEIEKSIKANIIWVA